MYRQRFKLLLLVVLFIGTTLFGNATELKRTGWNLIAVCQDISRADINMTGIDEIQSQDGQTIYTGAFAAYSNLETLEAGYAYWVKGTAGDSFESGHAKNRLTVSLRRTGWNLLGSCENISRTDINMTNFSEMQNQDGQTQYTGAFEAYSNLDGLELGVGYWVKGEMGTAFVSKRGLTLPIGFDYQTINNSGDTVETMHNGYNVRLYADYNETANDQSNHVGIVVRVNGSNSPLMMVQGTYQTHALVVGIYDVNGSLVGVSDAIIINGNTFIDVTTIADNLSPTPPTLTTTPPTTTTDSNTTVEVNGEVGSAVYVNGVEVATVGADGRVLVTLNLNTGDNNFSITLRDAQGNESSALSFVVLRNATNQAPAFDVNSMSSMFETHTISTDVSDARAVYSIDMDSDGDIDVLAIAYNRVLWYENNGTSSFEEHMISETITGANSIQAKDIDSDGDIDVSITAEDSVLWYENNGSQSFIERNISVNAYGANSIQVEDIDADGDIDIVATADNRVIWYENSGTQNFVEHNLSVNAYGANSVKAIDIDSDGDKDIVALTYNDDKILWYENNGTTSFLEHSISTSLNGLTALDVGDINRDGYIDLVVGSDGSPDAVILFINDGNQSFSAITVANIEAESVKLADVNGDGFMDIVTAEDDNDRVFWYENNGTEVFTEHLIAENVYGAISVSVNDINRDGRVDILSASANDNTIAWYGVTKGFNTPENNSSIGSITATDPDGDSLTYSLSGEDAALFSINSTTGALSFIGVPNFENPTDSNGDNAYSITISVTDGTQTVSQGIVVNIEDRPDVRPTLSHSTFSVVENTLENYRLGQVYTNSNGDSDITSFRLEGDANFDIDNSGYIYVASGAEIDYETTTSYALRAYASNDAGESDGVDINISVLDINKPILLTTPIYSNESNITFGVQGDDGDLLVINGVESSTVLGSSAVEVTLERDGSSVYLLQLKHADGTLSESVSFEIFDTLDIVLNDQNITEFIASTQRSGKYARYYTFQTNDERNITVNMTASFDTYLYLLDENGSRLYSDDDGGDGYNSKLEELLLPAGNYTIEATTFSNATVGTFDLNITDNRVDNNDTTLPSVPTLTTTPPTTTTDSNTTVEVNGEIGSAVYVNGVEVATVGADGRVLVTLNLNTGDNNFSITLRDAQGNESLALSFSINREETVVATSSVKKTGQTISYDESGNEVADGTQRDDGHYQKGTTSSYTRDDDNEVVTDNLTGLMWQDDAAVASVQKQWLTDANYDTCRNNTSDPACFDTTGDTATTYCDELVMGGFEDWRLPTRKELQGLADYGRYSPAINSTFVNTMSDYYWSSTTYANRSNLAWSVYFYSGNQNYDGKGNGYYVRCVRAGQ
ncbi:VCBS repeat-containing protein [bacterium]|nr:VCBS repeat-containing protein [bacterium]MBU1957384.1 VCBS repeat-containing protein [bacterium]